ncbi:MAG: glucose-6-phosphate isomerase [Thermodesulfobacteriota bacterium]
MTQSVPDSNIWQRLSRQAETIRQPENHLKHLVGQTGRFDAFSRIGAGIFYDFSRQRIDPETLSLLMELARFRKAKDQFVSMTRGEKINTTENRAALHTACRRFDDAAITVDGEDVMPEIKRVRQEIKGFSEEVHSGRITGSTGKPFKHLVVVGIGGSYLGTQFVSEALSAYADKGIELHYLANVDVHNFGRVAARIDPESTLWIIISKSYTTSETLANTEQAYAFMKEKGLDPSRHVVTVTSKGSPGDDPSNPVIRTFHMFDFIGGRYSVSSAVGGVPLSLFLGYDRFEAFLKGAQEMDRHTAEAPVESNLPLLSALIGIWNNNFLDYPALGIIPYADPLSKLAPHIQQLYMESNGKSVTREGADPKVSTGVLVFGEPGTNAQHSFFQMAHQGRPFPIDFLGVINPQYDQYRSMSKGVTNHQELWANLMSQPRALAEGKTAEDPARSFPGNRPSSTLLLESLSPQNIGRLLSFYEAKTVYEAFIWNINPFDQFGVELGKTMASGIRKEMAAKNQDKDHSFAHLGQHAKFYLESLYSGEMKEN